jgi:hypothetical protein
VVCLSLKTLLPYVPWICLAGEIAADGSAVALNENLIFLAESEFA